MVFRKALRILLPLAAAAAVGGVWVAGARVRNLTAEYASAAAIRDLTNHVEANRGEWPSSPGQLAHRPPDEAWIDFSISSDRILTAPEILKEAVRPKSGSFKSYPHYERDLGSLWEAIRRAKAEAGSSQEGA